MKIIGEFRASFIKDLRTYLRYPSWIANEFITTPLWFLFFALAMFLFAPIGSTVTSAPSSGIISYFYWGFVFVILFNTSIWGIGQSIRNEQLEGTMEQVFMAPVSRLTLIVGKWARTLLTDSLVVGYTGLIILLVGGVSIRIANPLLLFISIGLFELAILAFGLVFAAVALKLKAFNTIANFLFFTLIIFGGVFFPVTLLPFPLVLFSLAIPFTYYADMIKFAAVESPTLINWSVEFLLVVGLSIAMLLVGLQVFRWVERSVKIKGQIGTH